MLYYHNNGRVMKIYNSKEEFWRDLLGDCEDSLPDMCCECKFAHDLNIKLYSCDDDMEPIIYCDKHECICKAERLACDWAAADVE